MPADVLIDLSKLDLSRDVYDRDAVAAHNPHRF